MTTRSNSVRTAMLAGLVATALATLAGSASAQITAAQQSAIRANCRSDFMSKCSGVTPGGKDALVCLQKNVASLSGACKTAVSATLPPPAPAAAKSAPAPAAASTPPAPATTTPVTSAQPAPAATAPVTSAPPPRAKVAAPPRRMAPAAVAAPAPAAAPVATAVAPTAAQQSAIRSSCRNDFMAKCKGVTPGGKDALSCLQKHVGTLSPSCKQAVSATMAAPPAAAVTPASLTPPAAAAPPSKSGFVPGGLVISKACARYIVMHCRGMALDMGRKVACLVDYANSGHFVGPRCKAALKITGHLR